MLGKIESGLLYLMRVVMVILVLFTMFNFALWTYETLRKPKVDAVAATTVDDTRDWSAIKISDEDLKKVTYSDFGFADTQQVLNDNKLAADAGVVAAFADVDKQLRAALMRNPAARKKMDEENMEAGLTAAKPLPELVKELHDKELASNDAPALDVQASAVAAAAAIATEADSEEDYKPQPTDIGEQMLNQTRSIISSYGYNAGRAFALGAPAALQTLLADPQVQKGINKQSSSYVVGNVLMNYNMGFNTKAGESTTTPGTTWLERLLEPSNLLVFTVLAWSFVFLMMIVVFLRVERHLRAMALEGKTIADRTQP